MDQLGDAEHHDRDEWARFGDAQPAVERTTSYDIGAIGRRRFLKAVVEICWAHDVSWEWDLVGAPGLRKVEITLRGPHPALDGGRDADRHLASERGRVLVEPWRRWR